MDKYAATTWPFTCHRTITRVIAFVADFKGPYKKQIVFESHLLRSHILGFCYVWGKSTSRHYLIEDVQKQVSEPEHVFSCLVTYLPSVFYANL